MPPDYFRAIASLGDAFLAIDMRKDLGSIAAPTLVPAAEMDILKGERFARTMARGIRGARYISIADAGHAVAIERPGEVSRLVLEFLAGLDASPRA